MTLDYTSGPLEKWRKIETCPDYSVSDHGRVRRDTPGRGTRAGRILKNSPDCNGYACVNLHGRRKQYVHKLVALAFLGPPPSCKHQVAHWDGNGMNSALANIRWATQRENEKDKLRHGTTYQQPRGSRTLSRQQLEWILSIVGHGMSQRSAARELGVTHPVVQRASRNGVAGEHI